MKDQKHIIVSLGGSLIVPDEIDTEFLVIFVRTIKEYVEQGFHFVIITGGGRLCRKYNEATSKISSPSHEELDWLGISTTRVNAELVRIAFGDLAYEKIIMNPNIIPETTKPVLVGGGWKPGNSSDLAAVHSAKSFNAQKVINLSNIDFVYNKDPKKYPDAVPIKESSWEDYREIIPKEWGPGNNSPFDPIAAKEAEALGLEVAVINGKNINSFKNYLDGKPFIGTVIK